MNYQFNKLTYWLEDTSVVCYLCLKPGDLSNAEVIGKPGQAYLPETEDGELRCEFCRTLCTEETEEPGYFAPWTINRDNVVKALKNLAEELAIAQDNYEDNLLSYAIETLAYAIKAIN